MSGGEIRLRHATLEDVPLLRHWDQQPHIKESDPNDDWEWETPEQAARRIAAGQPPPDHYRPPE